MARPRILLLCVCLIAASAAVLPAGAPADKDLEGISVAELFPGARFDSGIPTQAQLLGLEPVSGGAGRGFAPRGPGRLLDHARGPSDGRIHRQR